MKTVTQARIIIFI